MNKQAQKEQAIKYLQQLDIYKPYIKGFEENDHVCFFEHYAGFWVYQEPEIEAKMKAIEKEYKCTVYAITHEFTQFGECYSFLIVTNYKHEWKTLLHSHKNQHPNLNNLITAISPSLKQITIVTFYAPACTEK